MLIAMLEIIMKCLDSTESWWNIGYQLSLVLGLTNNLLECLIWSFMIGLRRR
jgi:hypothetical protein